MDKKYELPDLLPAPTSDIGGLARRLIEYADLSVVLPLFDALQAAGRKGDLDFLKRAFSATASASFEMGNTIPRLRKSTWKSIAQSFTHLFWFDLFDLTETLALLERNLNQPQEPSDSETHQSDGAYGSPEPMPITAMENIAAGQRIEIVYPDAQVRVYHPPATEGTT